jgi:hypothetical protein
VVAQPQLTLSTAKACTVQILQTNMDIDYDKKHFVPDSIPPRDSSNVSSDNTFILIRETPNAENQFTPTAAQTIEDNASTKEANTILNVLQKMQLNFDVSFNSIVVQTKHALRNDHFQPPGPILQN